MKSKPMTAAQVDQINDRAEALARDRKQRILLASSSVEQISNNDFPLAKFMDALELYSQFIRNLEFADSADKRNGSLRLH